MEGGVWGLGWYSRFSTLAALLVEEGVGEGARVIGNSGPAAGLGAANTGSEINVGVGCVSAPFREGKLLSSNVTSLDNRTEWVCLSQSWYPLAPGSNPTSVTSMAFASNLRH